MRKLIEITSHSELVAQIVHQFAFMKLMSSAEDGNFVQLHILSLDTIFRKAEDYFVQFTDDNGLIFSNECNLESKIAEFLKEWETVTDVIAIQQNIHYRLLVMDKD